MEADSELIALLRARIAASKRSQKKIADQAGIHPSQLSQVLRGTKGLSRDRLLALAAVLGIADAEILTAAGLEGGAREVRADLSSPFSAGAKVKVVTDPRFIDSAVFMWMCSTQPFLRHGVELELARADWERVPEQFLSPESAVIGFYNRSYEGSDEDYPFPREILKNVNYWSDLSLYRGYAILARKKDLQHPSRFENHSASKDDIEKVLQEISFHTDAKRSARRFVSKELTDSRIITIGADTRWRLASSLYGEQLKPLPMKALSDPEAAVKAFLFGLGALFVGGLPQRLYAEDHDCVAIVTADEDPFLFSVNSLVCSASLRGSPLLYWIEALWAETIQRMQSDEGLRTKVARECRELLKTFDLDPEESSLQEGYFEKVFGVDGPKYETFVTHSSQLTSEFVAISGRMLSSLSGSKKSDLPALLAALDKSMRLAFGLEPQDALKQK
ncbi:MAG: helix-turn-helix domain-containing protein [Acidobacteriota bacterium]|nr:helix-turn-helix domain-containing protein [Acidobacteriota bacterium]